MKIFVLTLFAMFVTASLFLGCDEGMKMMEPAVMEDMAAEKESDPEPTPMPDEDRREGEEESDPEPTPMPTVVSITYYWSETRIPEAQILSPRFSGEVIYAEVVFSDNVPLVIADDETASPDIRLVVHQIEIPFHIVPHGSSGENFQNGDCKPVEEDRVFLCKNVIPDSVSISFSVKAITENGMMQSDSITVSHPNAVLIDDGIPPPPPLN